MYLLFLPKWIPNPIKWENYINAWNAVPFGMFFINSVIIAISVTFGKVVTSSLAALLLRGLNFWKG